MSQSLRQLPAVHRWLRAASAADLCAEFGRREVVAVMRTHLDRIRDEAARGVKPHAALEYAAYFCAAAVMLALKLFARTVR